CLRPFPGGLRGRAVGDLLGVGVALLVLDLAEVRTVEELLQADDLRALLRGVVDVLQMPLDHRVLAAGPAGLDERGLHFRHWCIPSIEAAEISAAAPRG